MGAACRRLGANCWEALNKSGPASGLFDPTFLKCNSIHDHLSTSSKGYQEVQNIDRKSIISPVHPKSTFRTFPGGICSNPSQRCI